MVLVMAISAVWPSAPMALSTQTATRQNTSSHPRQGPTRLTSRRDGDAGAELAVLSLRSVTSRGVRRSWWWSGARLRSWHEEGKSSVSGDQRLRVRASSLSWRRVGDEVVVLDLDETVYLTLNTSGAVLWDVLAEGATREELVQRLVADFGIDEQRAATDVDDFLRRCAAERLLEDADS